MFLHLFFFRVRATTNDYFMLARKVNDLFVVMLSWEVGGDRERELLALWLDGFGHSYSNGYRNVPVLASLFWPISQSTSRTAASRGESREHKSHKEAAKHQK